MNLRKKICLDGIWQMAADPGNLGKQEEWFNSIPKNKAVSGNVPAALEMTFPNYDGVVWYWKNLDLPSLYGQRTILHIGAAEYFCEIWANGQPAGQHEGGNAPAIFDITDFIQQGSNFLAIRLINPSNTPIDGFELRFIPHSNRVSNWKGSDNRWHNWGGIWQSVNILLVPVIYISDVFALPHWRDGSVTANITIKNTTNHTVSGKLTVRITPNQGSHTVAEQTFEVVSMPGITESNFSIIIPDAKEWSPDDPYLYRMEVCWNSPEIGDEMFVCFGLREFTFSDGYFRLNGRRFFPRCTHQAGHYPAGICRPWNKELFYRELLCLRQAGFNMMRALGYTPAAEQLDFADQLGILIYQETPASWFMEKSPEGPERWISNVKEMMLRDRNHASVVIWGLLNESIWWDKDGDIFNHAAKSLPELRKLDTSRMIVLDSGRKISVFSSPDYVHPDIGEYSLPETTEWMKGVADVHAYYRWPFADEDLLMSRIARNAWRGIDVGNCKVFYSEFGSGSAMDPSIALRKFEEWGVKEENDDYRFFYNMSQRFLQDWEQLHMSKVFPTPSHLIREGQRIQARKITDIWRFIQANPDQIGTSYTGFIDESGNGEGVYTYWRDVKPSVEAIRQAQKSLRWSLFVSSSNLYRGGKIRLEALLRNEDILMPGSYAARLLISGSDGIIWQKDFDIVIPQFINERHEVDQIVFPVCNEVIKFDYPPGFYEAYIYLLNGGDTWTSENLYITDAESLPKISTTVMELGLPKTSIEWLETHGISVLPFNPDSKNMPLLVHDIVSLHNAEKQISLALDFAYSGGTIVCLEIVGADYVVGASGKANDTVGEPVPPDYYQKIETILRMLPGGAKAEMLWDSRHWYVSTDHYVRSHPVFAGLPVRCLMADGIYESVYPLTTIKGLEGWDEITGAFCLGSLGGEWGYWHSTDLAVTGYGKGKIVISTYRLADILHADPTAGRMLLNLIKWLLKKN